jgi:hypothetical protein
VCEKRFDGIKRRSWGKGYLAFLGRPAVVTKSGRVA